VFFLFSGEGPTDIGYGKLSGIEINEAANFLYGPMTKIVEKIVEEKLCYSILDTGQCGFVSESVLTSRQKKSKLKPTKKGMILPGRKRKKETGYFYNNARIFAQIALEIEKARKINVVAILFRDSDGTASACRGMWDAKVKSMSDGFNDEGFLRGVPMIPKPKSEAWLICACQNTPYQNCAAIEEYSGNDASPNSVKRKLANIFAGRTLDREELCTIVENQFDISRITMSSFLKFHNTLLAILA
jgi:hypothetical protein